MDGRRDGQTDGWIDGCIDGWIDAGNILRRLCNCIKRNKFLTRKKGFSGRNPDIIFTSF